jgi:hypothetical protein
LLREGAQAQGPSDSGGLGALVPAPALMDLHPSALLQPLLHPPARLIDGPSALRLLLTSKAVAAAVPEVVAFYHFGAARLHLDPEVPASAGRAFRDCLYLRHPDQVALRSIIPAAAAARSPITYCIEAVFTLTRATDALHFPAGTFHPIPVELLLSAAHAAMDRSEPVPEWLMSSVPAELQPYAQQALYYAQVRHTLNTPSDRFPALLQAALNVRPDLKPMGVGMVSILLEYDFGKWDPSTVHPGQGLVRSFVPDPDQPLHLLRQLHHAYIALVTEAMDEHDAQEDVIGGDQCVAAFELRLRQLLAQGLDINLPLQHPDAEEGAPHPLRTLMEYRGMMPYVHVLLRHGRSAVGYLEPSLPVDGVGESVVNLPFLFPACWGWNVTALQYLLAMGADPGLTVVEGE